jgi:hypothetical protein
VSTRPKKENNMKTKKIVDIHSNSVEEEKKPDQLACRILTYLHIRNASEEDSFYAILGTLGILGKRLSLSPKELKRRFEEMLKNYEKLYEHPKEKKVMERKGTSSLKMYLGD